MWVSSPMMISKSVIATMCVLPRPYRVGKLLARSGRPARILLCLLKLRVHGDESEGPFPGCSMPMGPRSRAGRDIGYNARLDPAPFISLGGPLISPGGLQHAYLG